jgi:hypothetical protein
MFDNVISGKLVSFTTTLNGAAQTGLISPATVYTDTDGKAQVAISSTSVGDVSVTVRVTDSVVYNYGDPFTVRFKLDDRTPPDIEWYSQDKSALMDGDRVNPAGPIRIHVSDPGTNPSGVATNSITVSVKNAATGETINGAAVLSDCVYQTNCVVEWSPLASLAAGSYEVSLNVRDNNNNIQTAVLNVVVEGGNELGEIKVGPAVFNPRSGVPMQIGFQSPLDGTVVRLEIYDRSGALIYSSIMTAQAGFNAFEWNGRDLAGALPGNGIYVYRLVSNIGGRGVEQKGKLMIYKR